MALDNGRVSKPSESPTHSTTHATACLSCRQARQRCDRTQPCLRCRCHSLQCTYPARSNRGRKRGSTNKPETVEKLLSRINDSAVRDDVIAAIVRRHKRSNSPDNQADDSSSAGPELKSDRSDGERDEASYAGNDAQESLYSPLEILAAAVVAQKDQRRNLGSAQVSMSRSDSGSEHLHAAPGRQRRTARTLVDERLSSYFAPRLIDRTDYETLQSQPEDSRLKLDSTSEPVAAGLIDHSDVKLYFELFYAVRNCMIGLLDPELHTPDYVRKQSFTLFSVICALGCGVSSRPRDKYLHPVLASLAEENVKWSIAASVKSTETVQAIINLTYWAPTLDRLADDPYWLRVSHLTQLARELGLHRTQSIVQKVNALNITNSEERERLVRNGQRTWLWSFVVGVSFGTLISGRTLSVSTRDVPTNLGEWWQRPTASVFDRLVVSCAELRVVMFKAFEKRRRLGRTRDAFINWQRESFAAFSEIGHRWIPDEQAASVYLPVFLSYLDHCLLALNAHASRDLLSVDGNESSSEFVGMSHQTMDVAMRFMNRVISDPVMVRLRLGLHNTQFIMLSHAATEVLRVRRSVSADAASRAGSTILALANHIEEVAEALPPTSWASLYLRVFRVFVAQIDDSAAVPESSVPVDEGVKALNADWWKFIDVDSFNFANGLDMGFLDVDPQLTGTGWDMQY